MIYISIIHPRTEEEFHKYYYLRWEILRKPWNQPKIIGPVDDDNDAIHFLALDENESALGVCRMHFNTPNEAQCRFVATANNAQGKGVGKALMLAAENYALESGSTQMILHARENAVAFYQSIGYSIKEKSYLLFDEIQHYLMEKSL